MSSTQLTTQADESLSMADSRSLDLVLALGRAQAALLARVARDLEQRGYAGASPSVLAFLGQLDCGVNVASEVARRLGQSRQMVAKTTKHLVDLGYLETRRDPQRGNQKVIAFTPAGEALVAEARASLAALDGRLERALGSAALDRLVTQMTTIGRALEPGSDPSD
jgi:DNA-binding MarR family transcriptional regulator